MNDGLIRGVSRPRGALAVWRRGRIRWYWSVCVGGTSWTSPETSWTPRVHRRAARRLASTPNRADRRAVGALNDHA